MSDIKRYKMEFAPGSGGWIKQTARGELVLFTDHEAAIEQVLADVKARIEGALVDLTDRHDDDPYLKGYRIARRDALAALTQPQTEIHINSESEPSDEDKAIVGDLVNRAVDRMKSDGGGAATAADLDPREAFVAGFMFSGEGFNGECHNMSTIEATLDRRYEELVKPEEPGPYAEAFRENVCPVPEFPGIEKEES
jgi:hypothetical protein